MARGGYGSSGWAADSNTQEPRDRMKRTHRAPSHSRRRRPAADAVRETPPARNPPRRTEDPLDPRPLVDACLRHCPRGDGSLWNGGLGVAVYLRTKLGEVGDDDDKASCSQALGLLAATERGSSRERRASLLTNPVVGSECLRASLWRRLGQPGAAHRAAAAARDEISRVVGAQQQWRQQSTAAASHHCDCSVLFGLAGALQAVWYLRTELQDPAWGRELALSLTHTILLEGWKDGGDSKETVQLRWEWNGWPYLGAGTGAVGILHALLGHTNDEWKDLEDRLPGARGWVQRAVDDLARHCYSTPEAAGLGNLRRAATGWEDDESEPESPCEWTHGAPGYCLLLLRAFAVFGDDRYAHRARDLAENVLWGRCHARGIVEPRGCGLARGLPGMAYVFLAMGRVDRNHRTLWNQRARQLARVALADARSSATASRNYSLFEGLGGLAALLIDLERLQEQDALFANEDSTQKQQHLHLPHFPFFESCQADLGGHRFEYTARSEDLYPSSPVPKMPGSVAGTVPTQALTTSFLTPTPTTGRKMDPTDGDEISSSLELLALEISQLTEPSALDRNGGHEEDALSPTLARTTARGTPETIPELTRQPAADQPAPVRNAAPPVDLLDLVEESKKLKKPNRTPPSSGFLRNAVRNSPSGSNCGGKSRRASGSRKTRAQQKSAPNSTQARRAANPKHATWCGRDDGDGDDDTTSTNEAFMTASVERKQRAEANWIQHFGGSREKEQQQTMRRRYVGMASPPPGIRRLPPHMG